MKHKVVAGIDAGSTAIKVTLYNEDRLESRLSPTGWSPKAVATELLREAALGWGVRVEDLAYIVGTGYGRVSLPFVSKAMTEITCHAKGAAYLWPGVRTVIDVGGQDAKAIRVENNGKVLDFIMNDKCAAGTGRFLQVMANALGLDIMEIAKQELPPDQEECSINSMCTVFAESEVIGLLNQGFSRECIMLGLYRSIAGRIATMASHIHPEMPVVFTGGVAQNQALQKVLADKLDMPVMVPEHAVFAGSIGAALYAWEQVEKSYMGECRHG
ncbi:MAG TPA: acyl-CoA dehydratase activase [Negativicutes bacterium]|jgi:predicted CoA-substrate-specific enzyme activase